MDPVLTWSSLTWDSILGSENVMQPIYTGDHGESVEGHQAETDLNGRSDDDLMAEEERSPSEPSNIDLEATIPRDLDLHEGSAEIEDCLLSPPEIDELLRYLGLDQRQVTDHDHNYSLPELEDVPVDDILGAEQ